MFNVENLNENEAIDVKNQQIVRMYIFIIILEGPGGRAKGGGPVPGSGELLRGQQFRGPFRM